MNAAITETAPVVGGYRVGERLGEGGMGEVYRAVDTMLERDVALKVLRPDMSERADLVERFRVEAIALARLHHRHIAAVYAFFQQHERHYIAMQYVRGRTLEAMLQQRGALPWREAAAIAIDVLQALDHAHALGVVHRDLKPANLMIDHESRTVVMDFGIARVMARSRQTRAGTLVGTLEYIAPEIVRGDAADPRSDLYSLGCVLYEMVTGTLPFESPSDFALMRAHAEQAPPRPIARCADLPPAFEQVILRALEKQPGRRYASARAFLDALNAVVASAPRPVTSGGVATSARRAASIARDRGDAALRWLELPARGGWPAWRAWAGSNLGLVGAAGVAGGALLIALTMGTHRVCCSAPTPRPAPPPVVVADPAAPVQVAVEPTPVPAAPPLTAATPPAASPTPAPVAPAPQTLIVEPGVVLRIGANDTRPVTRSVRTDPPDAPPKARAVPTNDRPAASQPGWYVKR